MHIALAGSCSGPEGRFRAKRSTDSILSRTPIVRHENLEIGEKRRDVAAARPLGRKGNPDDVDRVALFLASDPARCVTGQTRNVDGGEVLG